MLKRKFKVKNRTHFAFPFAKLRSLWGKTFLVSRQDAKAQVEFHLKQEAYKITVAVAGVITCSIIRTECCQNKSLLVITHNKGVLFHAKQRKAANTLFYE